MRDVNPFNGRKIRSLEIIFENFESFKVDVSGICDFNMFDIKYSISLYAMSENDGDINALAYCNLFFVSLNEKGRMTHGEIDSSVYLNNYLKTNYITHVDLVFDDDSHLYVAVPWNDGDNDSINSLQEVGADSDYTFVKISGLVEQVML